MAIVVKQRCRSGFERTMVIPQAGRGQIESQQQMCKRQQELSKNLR
jgi:hypothetical protein